MFISPTHESGVAWIDAIHAALAAHLHQVPYGNLRTESTQWTDDGRETVNLAIVYEVPGGSTNQLNVTHTAPDDTYAYIALDNHDERVTQDLNEVLAMLQEAVSRIPDIRRTRLCEAIDRWAAEGMGQRQLFQQMTTLLQMDDLRGGAITMPEMKEGIAHILAHYRGTGEG
jgi:hypothetical protein